jgi:hypothetical protein
MTNVTWHPMTDIPPKDGPYLVCFWRGTTVGVAMFALHEDCPWWSANPVMWAEMPPMPAMPALTGNEKDWVAVQKRSKVVDPRSRLG